MRKKIFFDLDGTVADLYNKEGWLEDIQNELPIFENLKPIIDMQELEGFCMKLKARGYGIGIITWLPMHASEQYESACALEKRKWVSKYMPYIDEFYALRYGTPKQNASFIRGTLNYLIDDNQEVGKMWEERNNHLAVKVSEGNTLEEVTKHFSMI